MWRRCNVPSTIMDSIAGVCTCRLGGHTIASLHPGGCPGWVVPDHCSRADCAWSKGSLPWSCGFDSRARSHILAFAPTGNKHTLTPGKAQSKKKAEALVELIQKVSTRKAELQDCLTSPPRSNTANRPGSQTMPECRFNKSNATSHNRITRHNRDSGGSGVPSQQEGKKLDLCSKVIIGFPVSIPSALVKR